MTVHLCGVAFDIDDQPSVSCESVADRDDDRVIVRIVSTGGQEIAFRADPELLIQLGQDVFNTAMDEQRWQRARRIEQEVASTASVE